MKPIYHCLIVAVVLLAVIQTSQGQTFDLGPAVADSTLRDSMYLGRAFNPGDIKLIEVIKTIPDADFLTNSRNADSKPNPVDTVTGPLKIIYNNLHPHIPNQFAINTGKTVGEIPIQHQVGANGTTTYTVPIECAPGRAGVQPSIALSYNSLGGNGVLGQGWSIGGLSSISRTTSNYYYNGSAKPAEMTATAQFVMDGMRLIQTLTSSTVRTFTPEQGNIKIEAYLSGNVTQYFKVWFSNGSSAIYGYENNTVNKLQYPITSMTDVVGNTVKYTYEELNNHYYIKEIKYGSSKTVTNDFASIKFFYKSRTDVSGGWDAGIEITENRLLDYIQCINNNTTIRTYNFTYTFNKVNLLAQIDCTLSSGSLNPLKFYYGTNNPQTQFGKSTAQLTSWFSNTTVDKLAVSKGKFNAWRGDDALISYPALCPYVEYYTPSSLFSHSYRWYENMYHPDQTLLIYPELDDNIVYSFNGIKAGDGFMELTSGDVDGKAGDELIKINNKVSGTYDYITFSIYKYTGYWGYSTYKTTNYSPMTALDHNGRKSITPKNFIVSDFAGIGRMQVLAVSRYNPLETGNATRIMVFDIENQTTLCNITVSGFNNSSSDIIFAIDYDGDGRAEICHIHNNGTDIYAFTGTTTLSLSKVATISDLKRNWISSRKLMVGDINGDGKTDLLVSPYPSYYYGYYTYVPVTSHHYCPYCGIENPGSYSCRNCNSYLPPSDYCYECGSSLTYGCNGNYYDKCCPYHGTEVYTYVTEFVDGGNQWDIYYAKGSGGFDKKIQALINHDQNYNGAAAHYILQDINNDGRVDLVRFHNGSISVYPALSSGFSTATEPAYAYSSSSAYLIPTVVGQGNLHTQLLALNNGTIDKIAFSRNDTRQRMMSGAVNSLGVVSKSEYQEITEMNTYPSIYEPGYGATFPEENLNAFLWATAETQTWYNNVQKACNSYYYTSAIIHRQGLGFRGYTTFSITDNRGRTVKQTFNPQKYGILEKVESPASKEEYTYYVYTNSISKIATVRPTQQKVTDLLKTNVITTNYLSYDSYNQPLSVETEYGTGSGVKTKREYLYSNNNSGSGSSTIYVLGLPTEEKITNTRSGSSWINKTNITYSNYLPATKTTYTGTSGSLQTGYETFGYDTEGNMTSRSVKPYGSSKTLTTSYTYDAKKRWVTTEVNPMSLTTTYGYDGFGRLTSVKDYLNQTTNYKDYDGLDRVTKFETPDGVTSQTAFAWNSSNNGSVISETVTATKRPTSIKYMDAFGRKTRESVMGFSGTYSHTDYVYDEYGRIQKTSDPYTSTVRYSVYEYDTYDRLKKVTSSSGRITTTSYSNNTVTTVDDGMQTSKTSDASGALIQSSDPAGNITYTLRPDGQPSSIKTPDNVVTSFEYDTYGRQNKIIDPSAGTIKYDYNSEGLLWKQTNARGQITEYNQYTDWGQPKKVITPEQTIDYTYDTTIKNRLNKITAGSHYEITYGYDALGRINKETETEGTLSYVKDYTYEAGRIKTIKYNGVSADLLTYNYNANGYMSDMKFGSITIYTVNERDHFGQLKNYKYGNNVVTSRTYSDYGSPKTIKAGSFIDLSYNFNDINGTLTNRKDIINGNIQENFLYDNLRRLTNYNTSNLQNTVQYSSMGNINLKTDAGTFAYNVPGKPYAIGQLTPPAQQTLQVRYIRDAVNGSDANTSNHWVEVQAINSAGTNVALGKTATAGVTISNVSLITDGSISSNPYASAGSGSLIPITLDLGQIYNISNVKVWHYYKDLRTYNQSKTEISSNGTTWTTLHDAAVDGKYKESPLGRNYGPNSGIHTAPLNITYTSGERPNTIDADGLTASFTYNHAGERTLMQMNHTEANSSSIYYLGDCWERITRNGAVSYRLFLGGDAYTAPAVALRNSGNGGSWDIYYIHRDYLGSIIAVTDAAGAVVEKRSYDPWGRLRNPQTLKPYGLGEQPTLFLGRGYTGHEHLAEFGIINMNARLYDPILGRFLSPDPYVADPNYSQDYNRYAYALNNPLLYTDPDGEFIFTVLSAIFCPPLLPIAIKADVKAIINIVKNWDHIKSADNGWQTVGRIAGFYTIGAIDGAVSHYVPVLGPTLGNTFNSAMRGASFEQALWTFGTSLVSNIVGYAVGEGFSYLTKYGLSTFDVTNSLINSYLPSITKNIAGDFASNLLAEGVRTGSFRDAWKYAADPRNIAFSTINGLVEGSIDYYQYRQELKANRNTSTSPPSPLDLNKTPAPTLNVPPSVPLPMPPEITPLFPGTIEILPKSPPRRIPVRRPLFTPDPRGRDFSPW